MTSNNVLLMTLAELTQSQMFALASKYGIVQSLSGSFNSIKSLVFSTFADTILRFCVFTRLPGCTYLFWYATCFMCMVCIALYCIVLCVFCVLPSWRNE